MVIIIATIIFVVKKYEIAFKKSLKKCALQGTSKMVDTNTMVTKRKRVRPISKQGDFESRRLWQKVTAALKNGDIDSATEHKRYVSNSMLEGKFTLS